MAENNLKGLSIQWILFGVLFLSMMIFAGDFILNNNSGALGPIGDNFENIRSSMQTNLVDTEDSANLILNTTSENNPEVSDQGSKDSVGSSYGIFGIAKTIFTSFTAFFVLILPGNSGLVLIQILTGALFLIAAMYIYKYIRSGQ